MAQPNASLSLPPRQDTFLKVFSKHQLWPNTKPSFDSLSVKGQTAVITGGNVGLGLECAKILLSRGLSRLVFGVRSLDKGENIAVSLRAAYPGATITIWHLDLNSYDSIRSFAKKCADLPQLDMAILSAGIMNATYKASPTGHEEMFHVNYLSAALLGVLLLPVLRNTARTDHSGRLTFVASGAALIAQFSERNEASIIPAFDKSKEFSTAQAKARYDTTKGLVLMLAYKLSTMTSADETIVNVVDPSFTPGTSFFREMPVIAKVVLWPLMKLIGTSVNNAAWRYVDAVVARGKETHGSFISDWEISPMHAFMYTQEGLEFMDRLWEETVKEIGFPEVREALDRTHHETA